MAISAISPILMLAQNKAVSASWAIFLRSPDVFTLYFEKTAELNWLVLQLSSPPLLSSL